MGLVFSANRKVMGVKGEKNSISLPAIESCPEASAICKEVCYANRGMFSFKNSRRIQKENLEFFKLFLKASINGTAKMVSDQIKKNNKSGIFRWQGSGDIFSQNYWQLIKEVAKLTPEITFWIYTRSFDIIIDDFRKYDSINDIIPNLKLNISFDMDNYWNYAYCTAPSVSIENELMIDLLNCEGFVNKITWLGTDISETKGKCISTVNKWVACPVDAGTLDLDLGCSKCKLCFSPNSNIRTGIFFPIKVRGKEKRCKVTKMIQNIQANQVNLLPIR